MDLSNNQGNEFSVDEGAFWHTNLDLYYGFTPGEVVEVEHEPDKYWLATIEYCFKHLILLKWIGNYGEFWIDTSMQNATISTSSTFNEFNSPKRLFPLGYHLQSQLKSQFALEKPTKILIKPSLYNPSKDPYAEIKTVDDLLAHEVQHANDTFDIHQSTTTNIDPTSLVLAKCKTKVNYGQEDVDELEAALQNLNEIDKDEFKKCVKPLDDNLNELNKCESASYTEVVEPIKKETDNNNVVMSSNTSTSTNASTFPSLSTSGKISEKSNETDGDEAFLELCKKLQDSAINKGRYLGVSSDSKNQTDQVFFLKPKQFFDVGGANHERVFVPGTLVEVCHTKESPQGLELFHWFAFVIKNIGGRLKLRWFICDEPKFKQGRLELKSCRSKYIEEEEGEEEEETSANEHYDKIVEGIESKPTSIPVKAITFSLHFCDPFIHTISYAKSTERLYRLPESISLYIEGSSDSSTFSNLEKTQIEHVLDIRRMNLDKDRPLIDHILSTVRSRTPNYLDIIFAPKDKDNRREVLVSCPKMTHLIKGFVKRELEPGVFEVHTEPLSESGEIIKFIYPLDSSYAILPLDWAINNQDCLSINPSRNPTPTITENPVHNGKPDSKGSGANQKEDAKVALDVVCVSELSSSKKDEICLKSARYSFTHLSELARSNIPELKNISVFDEFEPTCWSRVIRAKELDAPVFHCCIDDSQRDLVDSKFKVMDQLEVIHPSSDTAICLGRIRKVVYPLIWIQISPDCYTLLPFNSTNIYPARWCQTYGHPLVSLLPPRKRCINQFTHQAENKKRKAKISIDDDNGLLDDHSMSNSDQIYEKEHFDLGTLNDRQANIDYILNEKCKYVKIYFNHKCFTGPSLSKSKICSLPQYVGPGPLRLVMEEVVTKVISVAYVPPRILNDLSSASFKKLLIERDLLQLEPIEFKAKYQKRVHREEILVCVNPDDVALYCECVCEHIKCCYNLFGPDLYDGDDCPGHCRALTKSNKFMKRATYYRDKARAGEFLGNNDNVGGKKSSNNNSNTLKTSRARYAGRGSSESTSSSVSRSEQLNSRASSVCGGEAPINDLKESLDSVEEMDDEENVDNENEDCQENLDKQTGYPIDLEFTSTCVEQEPKMDKIFSSKEQNVPDHIFIRKSPNSSKWSIEPEFNIFDSQEAHPEEWTVDDVGQHLEWCHLGRFKPYMKSEDIDGQALLLLDRAAIKELFQGQIRIEYTPEEVGKLCRFVDYVKTRADANAAGV